MKIYQILLHVLQQMSFFYDLIQNPVFDSVLFIFNCCFFWGGGGGGGKGGGRDKKRMRTYHELFHWHSNRHMMHLDLNSILPEQEFLQ